MPTPSLPPRILGPEPLGNSLSWPSKEKCASLLTAMFYLKQSAI